MIPAAVGEHTGAVQTTSSGVMQVDSKFLRSCAQNAMAVMACTHLGVGRKRLAHIITALGDPLSKWQGACAARCFSVASSMCAMRSSGCLATPMSWRTLASSCSRRIPTRTRTPSCRRTRSRRA